MSEMLTIAGYHSRMEIRVRHTKATPLHLCIYLLSVGALMPSLFASWMQGGWIVWLLTTITPQALLWFFARRQDVWKTTICTIAMLLASLCVGVAMDVREPWLSSLLIGIALTIPFFCARSAVRDVHRSRLERQFMRPKRT